MSATSPTILPLEQIQQEAVGGKAEGLAQLIAMDLPVPTGFVILNAKPGLLPADLDSHYQRLGAGTVAVRSSALGEDSEAASFAGQFDTYLDVAGLDDLTSAINACLESAHSGPAQDYRQQQAKDADTTMCVVVQNMVDARCAGVLFTVDPVTSRRAHMVIDAVAGVGEQLVSGESTPDHYLLHRNGHIVEQDLISDTPLLSKKELQALRSQSLAAEGKRQQPLDLEWAIDQKGQLYWLQARPITTLEADLNELDSPILSDQHVFTRCNVSEALPGAITPLTYSTTIRCMDLGLQSIHQRVGLLKAPVEEQYFIPMYYGNLFLNLSTMGEIATQALGSDTKQLALSICGRPVPELIDDPAPAFLTRLPRLIGYFRCMWQVDIYKNRLRQQLRTLCIPLCNQPLDQWQAIDNKMADLVLAHDSHLTSSMGSGMMTPLLLGVVAKGEEPTEAHHSQVAQWLSGATDVESANIATGATDIQDQLLKQPQQAEAFATMNPEQGLQFLQSLTSGEAGKLFRQYLERHGHRSISEMEMREIDWGSNPSPLVQSLQLAIKQRLDEPDKRSRNTNPSLGNLPANPLMRYLVKLAQSTVRNREETKSGMVKVTQRFKIAYRNLAKILVEHQLLTHSDELFFLTHQELGQLASGQQPQLCKLAQQRQKIYQRQNSLYFDDVCCGEPVPSKPFSVCDNTSSIMGKPVSHGHAIGKARVATNIAEAQLIERGEILIAPITDIAWTPYFSLIQGLATDIGSAVSHGAVVAREYGLPAIVKTNVGTQVFKTGDWVVLDADTGVLRLASQAEIATKTGSEEAVEAEKT